MGDRGQVLIKNENAEEKGVYLYTHWEASELDKTVARALAKRWRWGDPEYLARIVFEEMIGKQRNTETGFGISTSEHGDIWRLIIIDCDKQSVIIEDNNEPSLERTFDEFIKETL